MSWVIGASFYILLFVVLVIFFNFASCGLNNLFCVFSPLIRHPWRVRHWRYLRMIGWRKRLR